MSIQEVSDKTDIPAEFSGLRLDAALAKCLPQYSRSQLSQWLKQGWVLIDGKPALPKEKVKGGEHVEINAELPKLSDAPEDVALDILYEDDDLFIVNKPAGLVMYPAAGHFEGTLLNAILHHHPAGESLPRAGIIHRLDKGTTGLCVIAKNTNARNQLVEMLERRDIKREYYALVKGEFIAGDTIEGNIDRHPKIRTKMAVVKNGGKPARTHYRIESRFCDYTLLHVTLDTGRTHQIRVHMSYIGHPLVGDSNYGWRCQIPHALSDEAKEALKAFPRPALHAFRLSFIHPCTQKEVSVTAPMPEDMRQLMAHLNKA